MIGYCKREFRPSHLAVGDPQRLECLRTGNFGVLSSRFSDMSATLASLQ
jgi:hypothetical protein